MFNYIQLNIFNLKMMSVTCYYFFFFVNVCKGFKGCYHCYLDCIIMLRRQRTFIKIIFNNLLTFDLLNFLNGLSLSSIFGSAHYHFYWNQDENLKLTNQQKKAWLDCRLHRCAGLPGLIVLVAKLVTFTSSYSEDRNHQSLFNIILRSVVHVLFSHNIHVHDTDDRDEFYFPKLKVTRL